MSSNAKGKRGGRRIDGRKNSREKGRKGELEFKNFLRDVLGFANARRGVQYAGGPDSPDVVGIDGVHIEVKRTEQLRLHEAMKQAVDDACNNVPVVAHRKNGEPWLLTIRAKDLFRLADRLPHVEVRVEAVDV